MEHLVRFTNDEGREGQHTADSLDDALRFVERLRNSEAVAEVRVFRMQEVPISFRTYFKVELAGEPEAPVAGPPAVPADVDGERHSAAAVAATPDGPLDAGGRRLFSRA